MRISREELGRRLEQGARVRRLLRIATLEWIAIGDRLRADARRAAAARASADGKPTPRAAAQG